MDLAKDLELPGLPTKKRGIRSSMHTAIMKMFSLRAAFRAMFGPRVMLSNSTSWHLGVSDGNNESKPYPLGPAFFNYMKPKKVRGWKRGNNKYTFLLRNTKPFQLTI